MENEKLDTFFVLNQTNDEMINEYNKISITILKSSLEEHNLRGIA